MSEIDSYYTVKSEGKYPWPLASEPGRTVLLFTDDILTKSENGTYSRLTGLGVSGIVLRDDEVTFVDDQPGELEIR